VNWGGFSSSTATKLFVPPEALSAGGAPPVSLHKRKVASDAEISADPIHSEIVGIGALLTQTQKLTVLVRTQAPCYNLSTSCQTSGSKVSTSTLGSA